MKIIKQFGLYGILALVLLVLAAVGFITERNKILNDEVEDITYEPSTTTVPALTEKKEDDFTPEAPEPATVVKEEPPAAAPEEETVYEAVAADTVPLAFSVPFSGELIQGYSGSEMVYSETMKDYRAHLGVDFAADEGTPVFVTAFGTVSSVNEDDFYGLTVTVDHGGGLKSVYSGLSEAFVEQGEELARGTTIGTVGSSAHCEAALGAHLHFEAKLDGENMDPEELFR